MRAILLLSLLLILPCSTSFLILSPPRPHTHILTSRKPNNNRFNNLPSLLLLQTSSSDEGASDTPPSPPTPTSPPLTLLAPSLLGALDTFYLTLSKLSPTSLGPLTPLTKLCTETCNSIVLSSPYSQLTLLGFTVPLSSLGLLSYTLLLLLPFTPLRTTFLPLLLKTNALVSTLLLASLVVVFKVPCGYCILSAACSYAAAYAGLRWLDSGVVSDAADGSAKPSSSSHSLKSWRGATALAGLCAALVLGQATPNALADAGGGAATAVTSVSSSVLYTPPPVTSSTDNRSLAGERYAHVSLK